MEQRDMLFLHLLFYLFIWFVAIFGFLMGLILPYFFDLARPWIFQMVTIAILMTQFFLIYLEIRASGSDFVDRVCQKQIVLKTLYYWYCLALEKQSDT